MAAFADLNVAVKAQTPEPEQYLSDIARAVHLAQQALASYRKVEADIDELQVLLVKGGQ